ncbi:MAG: DUF1656 domain-containing protein [Phycisphaerales bacterium]|nr:DUF1656 domain-containing protein [Phycisphaerales bacterium]
MPIPKEIDFHGVYLPPILLVLILAIIATMLTTRILNRLRWTRFLVFPQVVFVAFIAIYTVLIGTFFIRI